MSDYRQYPDPEPRGRHARARVQQQADAQGFAPRAQDARRAVGHQAPMPADPRRQGAQQGYRPASQARTTPAQQAQRQDPRAARQQFPQQAYRPAASYGYAGASAGPAGAGAGGAGSAAGKKKGGPWRVVFWIALVVLVVALAALGALAFSYWQGQKAYDEIAATGFSAPSDIEATPLADLEVDWDALLAINPDTVGWVYVPGTNINYPIVHTDNDETYLTRDFNGEQSWGATYGCIFLSAANAPDFSDANSIVYGHHLNNGAMFAAIAGFDDAGEFNAHRTVYILTPQGNYKLTTFSLVHCAADDPLAQVSFASEEERVAYVQDKLDRSTVAVSDVPAASDMERTFALATCDNLPSDGRYVLFAYVAESSAAVEGTDGAAVSQEAESVVEDPSYAPEEAAQEAPAEGAGEEAAA